MDQARNEDRPPMARTRQKNAATASPSRRLMLPENGGCGSDSTNADSRVMAEVTGSQASIQRRPGLGSSGLLQGSTRDRVFMRREHLTTDRRLSHPFIRFHFSGRVWE